MGHTHKPQYGDFPEEIPENSRKTPEKLSERFLEFPSRVRLGCPKPYNSRDLRLPEQFQNSLPPVRLGTPLFSEVVPERASQSWSWNSWQYWGYFWYQALKSGAEFFSISIFQQERHPDTLTLKKLINPCKPRYLPSLLLWARSTSRHSKDLQPTSCCDYKWWVWRAVPWERAMPSQKWGNTRNTVWRVVFWE